MIPVEEALKTCVLFKGFTDTGIKILATIATPRDFRQGTPLFVENMAGDSLFILAEGTVRLSAKRDKAGEDVVLGQLGPGDCLGELALIHQSQRMCTATAVSAVSALELRHADFQKLLAQKPQACVKLLMAIVSQFGARISENREAFRSLIPKSGTPPKG